MKAKDIENKNVAELKTMARKKGIALKSSWKKADIIKAIVSAKPAAKKGTAKKKTKTVKKKAVSAKSTKKVKKKTVKKAAKKTIKKTVKKTAKKAVKKAVSKKTTTAPAKKATPKKAKKTIKKTAAKTRGKAVKKPPVKTKKAAVKKKTISRGSVKRAKTSSRTSSGKTAKPPVRRSPAIVREKIKRPVMENRSLPAQNKVSLMVVDPYKLFVFWEINERELNAIVQDGKPFSFLLRVYFFRESEQTGFFDINVSEPFGKKYIEVIPERGYQVELILSKGNSVISLARSKIKFTPAFRIDREFSSPEEAELYLSQIPPSGNRISS